MQVEQLIQIENEIFTKLVIDKLKEQRAKGITDFLLDKAEIHKTTAERLKKLILENGQD